MKKITVLTLSLAMMLSFASCGDSDKSARHDSDIIESEDNSKADKIAEIYAEAQCGNTDGETLLQLEYPDEYISKIKNLVSPIPYDEYGAAINNAYEYYIYFYNSNLKSHRTNGLPKWEVVSVNKKNDLSKEDCRLAESCFEEKYDVSLDIGKGFCYEMKYRSVASGSEGKNEFWVLNSGDEWKALSEFDINIIQEML